MSHLKVRSFDSTGILRRFKQWEKGKLLDLDDKGDVILLNTLIQQSTRRNVPESLSIP